ncbi:hypothetical protein C1701_25030 [Actinoalloteichus sp. AHMU CJ021]|uniref:Lipoprotein n=1 Tax=Actinoalloteichus caeruleus DSM 43889 TaxID=1120930 RepID=A0ABT1JDG6_ACTCY|nr:hypothetical protein [Actinoalloteichus caeruleus]AUS81061.1 hypothetical protein C1701_25030 [Actinoalloteichus sp. AHMU CJ021]MCP2330545.1 hypothetical protein [Actinoalloteichus caeruleus DSM 43889]
MRRLVGILAITTVGLTGCFGVEAQDEAAEQAVEPARPAEAPAADRPAGDVMDLAGDVTALVADPDSRTLAALVEDQLLVLPLDDPEGTADEVDLPGPGASVSLAAPGGPLLVSVPDAELLVEVDPDTLGTHERPTPLPATSATRFDSTTGLAHAEEGVVTLDRGDEAVRVEGFHQPVEVIAAEGRVFVLDVAESAVIRLDEQEREKGLGLRAGEGATNAVTDSYGRILVTETRSGELLAFSAEPFLLRQRYPVPGAPYGIAYDEERDLAWVTLTETNELVGYEMLGGEPVEVHRFPTVRQPNEVAVDPSTGAVFVGSAAGEGIQVVRP